MVNEALLTLLRWGLIGLLYLFFFRVLQVTWVGSRAVTPLQRRKQKSSRPPDAEARQVFVLVGIQPPELAGQEFAVNTELTIGRASNCTITMDDSYLSQAHVRISQQAHGTVVEDLNSTNGTYLNQNRVTEPVLASPGDTLQLGGIVMELR